MYKIYINENLLVLSSLVEMQTSDIQMDTGIPFAGRTSTLFNVIDKLEKNPDKMTFGVYHDDLPQMWKAFKGIYKVIKAAGGIVRREDEKCLFIERMSKWDLPKGKKDRGEKAPQTAIREVFEETGLKCVIESKIINTWHTYREPDGTRILKKTNWYEMNVLNGEVKLQVEEQITDHRWMTPTAFLDSELDTYRSITGLVAAYLDLQRS